MVSYRVAPAVLSLDHWAQLSSLPRREGAYEARLRLLTSSVSGAVAIAELIRRACDGMRSSATAGVERGRASRLDGLPGGVATAGAA